MVWPNDGQRAAELECSRERRAMIAARRLDERASTQQRRARERIGRHGRLDRLDQPGRLLDRAALDQDLRQPPMRCPPEPDLPMRERFQRGTPVCLGLDQRPARVLEDRAGHREAREVKDGAAPAHIRQRRVEQADALVEAVGVEQRVRASGVVARALLVGHRRQRSERRRRGVLGIAAAHGLVVCLPGEQHARSRPLVERQVEPRQQLPRALVLRGHPGRVDDELRLQPVPQLEVEIRVLGQRALRAPRRPPPLRPPSTARARAPATPRLAGRARAGATAASRKVRDDVRRAERSPRRPQARAAARPAPRPPAAPRAPASSSGPRSRDPPRPPRGARRRAAARPRAERSRAVRAGAAPQPAQAARRARRAARRRGRARPRAPARGCSRRPRCGRAGARTRTAAPAAAGRRGRARPRRARSAAARAPPGRPPARARLGRRARRRHAQVAPPPPAGVPAAGAPSGSPRRERAARRPAPTLRPEPRPRRRASATARAGAAGCRPSRDGRQEQNASSASAPSSCWTSSATEGALSAFGRTIAVAGSASSSASSGCSSSTGASVAKYANGHALEPTRQICQPAQRRRVRPLHVVDRERKRPRLRQVDRQPVEPVQERIDVLFAPRRSRPD